VNGGEPLARVEIAIYWRRVFRVERRLSVALAGTGLVAALLVLVIGHKPSASTADVETVAGELDALVREATASVQARADTLAQLPRLGWIVATDEATVGDLTADELEFRPHPGEQIELAQMRKRDGQVRVLRRLPAAGAVPLPVSRPGVHLMIVAGRLQVVAVVPIPVRLRGDELAGALAVAKGVDTAAIARSLDALGVAARLQTVGGSAPLGRGGTITANAATTVRLKSAAAEGAVLVAARGPNRWGARVAAWLLFAVSLGGAGVLWRRGARTRNTSPRALDLRRRFAPAAGVASVAASEPSRASPPSEAPTVAASPAALARAAVTAPRRVVAPGPPPIAGVLGKVAARRNDDDDDDGTVIAPGTGDDDGTVIAPGTGSEVDAPPEEGNSELTYDPDATALADPSAQRAALTRSRSGSVPIVPSRTPAAGVAVARRLTPAAMAAAEADPATAEYRALFAEYVSLRRTCGEPVDTLNREDFVETLRRTRQRLIREDAARDVQFRLAFANGKAVIRFTTVS
jgi:hypothetical protein